jgi:hypothetical protein
MKFLDSNMMKYLSFPDYEVEEMQIDFQNKKLRISLDGGYLDVSNGGRLGCGILFLHNWDSVSVMKFDLSDKNGKNLDEGEIEPLKDLCEASFSESLVTLAGFGKKSGEWFEWKILHPQMHAEFEDFSKIN